MGVLHDYKCEKHGFFESREAVCPEGCKKVMRVYLRAPAVMSKRTKNADKTLKNLANDFGMTNMRSTREGESQQGYFKRNNKTPDTVIETQNIPREPQPRDSAIWGGGQGLSMQNVLAGRAARSIHGEAVGVNLKETPNLTGPRAASYFPDQDNLQVKP